MKKLLLIGTLLSLFSVQAQVIKDKKYPSLLWEITGKGLKRPSFLIGTMHVSNKLAFNLPDSFYYALRSVDVVALETNPETWQEDMTRFDLSGTREFSSSSQFDDFDDLPSDYFNISTLKFFKYYGKLQRGLSSNPSSINNLLYRTYGDESSDFEEDTYLDMYIFQCGKKWGKKIAGVESFGESMRLMAEAYTDAVHEKNKKDRSYGDFNAALSSDRLQEAYRTGNLDLLDSINHYNSSSAAFDEKFIYRRNEIQANSIDSIIRSGNSLFVGVGAAHLPGSRGVIEILRRKGYTLRPVRMGERASREKEVVDKVKVPVVFHTETADDGFYKVDVPGKLFKLSEDPALRQNQFADMANGSYYMVTRIMTNAWMWGQAATDVYKKIDSLLYENIPGKIIARINIIRNGYKGFDVSSKTRRGDFQRYNIFVTPYEVIIFKMSGNGDYISNSTEAQRFFGSIQMKEYKVENTNWQKFSPSFGGFTVDLPHQPYPGNDGSWIFDATDKETGSFFRVMRSDVNNFRFVEEDSFDLGLMNESFKASAFIDSQISRKQSRFKDYPLLEAQYRDKEGQYYFTRFIIQGSHYYSLIARAKKDNPAIQRFLNSFEIKPFTYPDQKLYTDTSLYFSVRAAINAESKKKFYVPRMAYSIYGPDEGENDDTEKDKLENGVYRRRAFSNDSTGETVFVTFFHSDPYRRRNDSLMMFEKIPVAFLSDSSVFTVGRKRLEDPFGFKGWMSIIADTNSSRQLWTRTLYKNGTGYILTTMTDSVTRLSPYQKSFFESFTPIFAGTKEDNIPKPSILFFRQLHSGDTLVRQRAIREINGVDMDASDLSQLDEAIRSIGWNEKKYLDTKIALIDKLGGIRTEKAADKLVQLYYAAGDTIQLQYAALENLLQQKTVYAFKSFSDIMTNEPPVLEPVNPYHGKWTISSSDDVDNGSFMDELFDSLSLTRSILPGLLPLLNLKDYESPVLNLLAGMLDKKLVQADDYKQYYSKFILEARQELKKQSIEEKKRAIRKAEQDKDDDKSGYTSGDRDRGNAELALFADLLMPFEAENHSVGSFLTQLLRSNDRRLQLATLLLFVKKGKTVPDSLLQQLAATDLYRYELYSGLNKLNKLGLFPSKWNNHEDLARSVLFVQNDYSDPDTLVYLDKIRLSYRNKQGFVFFFKYKMKVDDVNWKLGSVGLVPEDPLKFETDQVEEYDIQRKGTSLTQLSNTRLNPDAPVRPQLERLVNEWLVKQHNSGKEFYTGEEDEPEE